MTDSNGAISQADGAGDSWCEPTAAATVGAGEQTQLGMMLPPRGEVRVTALAPGQVALSSFSNLERALEIDKLRSLRSEAREFMCIRDQVLVVECEREEMSDSGLLHIPGTAQGKQVEGIVIAVGPGRLDANNVWIATVVQPGDRVLYGRYAGTEQKLRGRQVRLIREEEILGVMR